MHILSINTWNIHSDSPYPGSSNKPQQNEMKSYGVCSLTMESK